MRNYTFTDSTGSGGAKAPDKRWHAVGVVGTANACAAARACKDSRYLSVDAPRLPLKGCDAPVCDCKYRHYPDRRQAARREGEDGTLAAKPPGAERRGGRGRRSTD